MKYTHRILFAVALVAAVSQSRAQEAATTTSASSPVAYVYVTRPTHVDGFAGASNGKLTPIPGSPFSNMALNHLSVTKNFLFGAGNDGVHLYSYSIASNGSLKQVASTDVTNYAPGAYGVGPTQLDTTGSTLYNFSEFPGSDTYVQAYKIEGNGELEFVSTVETDINFDAQEVSPTMIRFISNDKFAYETGCDQDALNPATDGFKRAANGSLTFVSHDTNLPKPPNSGDQYCPAMLATDSSGHVAFVMDDWNVSQGQRVGPEVIATYTANSAGQLTTTSSYKNMPALKTSGGVYAMSISPSGKLLATSGYSKGFQVFHFNGADPATAYTDVLLPGDPVLQFGWDDADHLYALTPNALHVFNATTTSVKEAEGSPYSIPEESSIIVLSPK